jgi:hypothetical protein
MLRAGAKVLHRPAVPGPRAIALVGGCRSRVEVSWDAVSAGVAEARRRLCPIRNHGTFFGLK